MAGFGLIVARDVRDLVGGTAFRVFAASLLLVAALLAASLPAGLLLVGTMLYLVSLLPFLALLWIFAGAILIKEKASGHLETLLATPLGTGTLWLAKTAALALPGLVLAGISSALIVVAVGSRARPEAAASVPLQWLAVCWLGNPLLCSGLGALTVVLALRSSPDVAIVPSFAVGFGVMATVPAGAAVRIFDLSSWAFALGYLGTGAIEWIGVLLLARGLTKERIVLSSREG